MFCGAHPLFVTKLVQFFLLSVFLYRRVFPVAQEFTLGSWMKITGIKYSMLKKKTHLSISQAYAPQDLIKGIELLWATIQSSLSCPGEKVEGEKESSWSTLEQCLQCRNRMRCYSCLKPREGVFKVTAWAVWGHSYIEELGRVHPGPLRKFGVCAHQSCLTPANLAGQ